MQFNFYSDPGHGWLRVRRSLLMELGIEDKISRFSYQSGKWVYLEEDCDVGVLLEALRSKPGNYAFSVRNHHANRESKIRRHARYRFDFIDKGASV